MHENVRYLLAIVALLIERGIDSIWVTTGYLTVRSPTSIRNGKQHRERYRIKGEPERRFLRFKSEKVSQSDGFLGIFVQGNFILPLLQFETTFFAGCFEEGRWENAKKNREWIMRDDSFVVEAFVAMWKMLKKIMETINGLKKVFNFCLSTQTNGRREKAPPNFRGGVLRSGVHWVCRKNPP